MKVLYAIQGTGNGHVCRAFDIVPILSAKADVDVLISGIQSDIKLPFPVKYFFGGLSFIFGKKGGVDLLETYKKSHVKRLLNEIRLLPVEAYDLVISDFEPVSAWACALRSKPCIALSHQSAILSREAPQAKHIDPVGRAILKVYAPSSIRYGFHFKRYDDRIFTPVIRKEVRTALVSDEGHYTVYLPAYSDKRIIDMLGQCTGVKWQVFSKHFSEVADTGNVKVLPLDSGSFVKSMASSSGVLCGAGFETPAEALFLGKKLMVIPMKKQFEQHCNAAALSEMGVPVMKSLKPKHLPVLQDWLASGQRICVNYPDQTEEIISNILRMHGDVQPDAGVEHDEVTPKQFRALTLKRILNKLAQG